MNTTFISYIIIMSNNICNDAAYLNLLDQKTRFQILNIPPVRYDNLAKNPYQTPSPSGLLYTKFDLDMRRKAEILKYSSNRMGTQTNNLTRAQIYAQSATTGRYQQRTYSQQFINENTQNGILVVCPSGTIIKTPSSASGVPGPPIMLYDDETVPLYNFTNANAGAYGIINQATNPYTTPWDFTNILNILAPYISGSVIYTTITSLYIISVDSPYYIFAVSVPLALSITGTYQTGITTRNYADDNALRIQIYSVSMNIKYSYSTVTLNYPVNYQYNTVPMDISVNLTSASAFSASCYFGLLNVSNIHLPTQQGFIYDIQFDINYQISYPSGNYTKYCNDPSITTCYNVSSNTLFGTSACTLSGNPLIPPIFPVLQFSGIPSES